MSKCKSRVLVRRTVFDYNCSMLRWLVSTKSDHIGIQFVRYGFVAIAAFVVDFGLLFVFTRYMHIFYLLSATLSFSISLVLNYALSILWVFSKSTYRRHVEILLFIVIGIVGLGLNILIIWACTRFLGLFYLLSKLIAVAIVFFWSFVARRFLLFHNQTKPGNS